MKDYQLFYLIYWAIVIGVLLWYIDWAQILIHAIKMSFGMRKFYKIVCDGCRVQPFNSYTFVSLDNFKALDYEKLENSRHRFRIIVEDVSPKEGRERKYYPQYMFVPMTAKGVLDMEFCYDYLDGKKVIDLAFENLMEKKRLKFSWRRMKLLPT